MGKATYIESQRGAKKLLFRGHDYVFKRDLKGGERIWRCSDYKCLGRAISYSEDDVRPHQDHTCQRRSGIK